MCGGISEINALNGITQKLIFKIPSIRKGMDKFVYVSISLDSGIKYFLIIPDMNLSWHLFCTQNSV